MGKGKDNRSLTAAYEHELDRWERETGEHRDSYPLDRDEFELEKIAVQARRVIDSIEGSERSGGVALWVALWDLRALLLDLDRLDLPQPGGSA